MSQEPLDRAATWAGLARQAIRQVRAVVDAKFSICLLLADWPDEAELRAQLKAEYLASRELLCEVAAACGQGERWRPYQGRQVALDWAAVELLRRNLGAETWVELRRVRERLRSARTLWQALAKEE